MNRYVIVVGIEHGEHGEKALDAAIQMAALHPNGEVHALHVDAGPGVPSERGKLAHSSVALDQVEELCQARLQAMAERGARPRRLSTHFRYGTPAEQIIQLAADFDADMVVVGTHGRTGVTRLVVGSVAEKVVRTAPCPVLVVRDKALVAAAQTLDLIEPLCEACRRVRADTGGDTVWCERHAEPRHITSHRYTYSYRGDSGRPQSTSFGTSG